MSTNTIFKNSQPHDSEPNRKELNQSQLSGKETSKWTWFKSRIFFTIILMFVVTINTVKIHKHVPEPISPGLVKRSEQLMLPTRLLANSILSASSSNQRTIFQVTYPNVAGNYGPSVARQTLLTHTFGNSWGSPATVTYTPPNVKFNKVVLTLNTTCQGVQFDRLAHLFLSGVPIWRTSTMEPGGAAVFSSFPKDVSIYSDIFQRDGELYFKLDNLITSVYTGSFDTILTADYYYVETPDAIPGIEGILDDTESPKVLSLTSEPLFDLSNDSLNISLPALNSNTTRLKLRIFTSGNGDEEFWYTNALNAVVADNPSAGLRGHGPIRTVLVKYNGQVIANTFPQPVIFTGGISPALWSPMVSVSAFDLEPIEIDLTALIPGLQPSDKIEVAVGNGDVEDGQMGSEWITAANLLVWENSLVKSTEGKPVQQTFNQHPTVVNDPQGNLNQTVSYEFSAQMSSFITFELVNGTKQDVFVEYDTKGSTLNSQIYLSGGNTQLTSQTSQFNKHLKISKINGDSIIDVNSQFNYPVDVNAEYTQNGSDITMNVNVVNGYDISVDTQSSNLYKILNHQNASSIFIQSSAGNHGSGNNEDTYSLDDHLADVHYFRHVKVYSNGTYEYDESYGG